MERCSACLPGWPCPWHTAIQSVPLVVRPDPLMSSVLVEEEPEPTTGIGRIIRNLLKRKPKLENSMACKKEITAKFEDLVKAGCTVTPCTKGAIILWPPKLNPPVAKVLSESSDQLKVVHNHLNPSALEQRLQDLGVEYTVRIFDPEQPKKALPGLPFPRSITVAIKDLAPFAMGRQGGKLTVSIIGQDNKRHTFISTQEDYLSCEALLSVKSVLEELLDENAVPYNVSSVNGVELFNQPKASNRLEPRVVTAKYKDLKAAGCRVEGDRVFFSYGFVTGCWESTRPGFLHVELNGGKTTVLECFLAEKKVPHCIEYPFSVKPVVSIQIAATRHSDDGVEVVAEDSEDKTHYSVYLRREGGCAEIHSDIPIKGSTAPRARTQALAQAARLSIEHQVPIERID